MSIEAMKQALQTLEGWANVDGWVWPETAKEQALRNTVEAITALRQAIAQAEQKPCLKGGQCKHGSWCSEVYCQEHCEFVEQAEQAQPMERMSNEDVNAIRIRIMCEAYDLADRGDSEGYNSVKVMCSDVLALLSRRQWVGLTDEQLEQMWEADKTSPEDCQSLYYFKKIARAVEAKLKD
jgi:hypothetical protein